MSDDVNICFWDIDIAYAGSVLFESDLLPAVFSLVLCPSAADEQIFCVLTEIDESFAIAKLTHLAAEIGLCLLHMMYQSIAPYAGNMDRSNDIFPDRYHKINGHN